VPNRGPYQELQGFRLEPLKRVWDWDKKNDAMPKEFRQFSPTWSEGQDPFAPRFLLS
jgi:hypothetical protein